MLKAAFASIAAFQKKKERLALAVQGLFCRKTRGFFSNFRMKQAQKSAENRSARLMRLYFGLESIARRKFAAVFRAFKRKSLQKFELGLKSVGSWCEKSMEKQLRLCWRGLQENDRRKRLENREKSEKIARFSEISEGFYRKIKLRTLFQLKFNRMKRNVRQLLRIYQVKSRDFVRMAFFKWRGNVIVRKIARKNLTNKVKAKILLSFSRNESNLDVKRAFLRWKVKANRSLLKNTMDR
jgi:hypothetical protein